MSWVEQKMKESWRLRWAIRLDRIKYRLIDIPYWWITDTLVWDFEIYPEGRLMHFRSKKFLNSDDPRHYDC